MQINYPIDYPRPLTGDTEKDMYQLWEDLWRAVERINLNEQARADAESRRRIDD